MKIARDHHGFHLMEVLITMTIIGILAVSGIPRYSHYFTFVHRLEAKSTLAKLAIAMEHFHIEHNTYRDADLNHLSIHLEEVTAYYHFYIQTATDSMYLLAAKPIGSQAQSDQVCGTLTLNALGEKNISGPGNINECW